MVNDKKSFDIIKLVIKYFIDHRHELQESATDLVHAYKFIARLVKEKQKKENQKQEV